MNIFWIQERIQFRLQIFVKTGNNLLYWKAVRSLCKLRSRWGWKGQVFSGLVILKPRPVSARSPDLGCFYTCPDLTNTLTVPFTLVSIRGPISNLTPLSRNSSVSLENETFPQNLVQVLASINHLIKRCLIHVQF